MEFDKPRGPFICPMPSFDLRFLGNKRRNFLVYLSGILFAISWWVFIDAIVSSHLSSDTQSRPYIEDYIVGSISTIGMSIVNSLDPSLIKGESFTYSGSSLAWKARLILFFGITANAGACIGAITIACIKYYLKTTSVAYVGTALIIQTFGILASCIILWIAQSMENEGLYSIVLS
ncbi:Vacuolar protein sorting-associated protein 68 [Entomophthora muscae]|uniref:Vacuolar protein sorting-associated protein 68 n=1 Tax=Entomophthora muscae TaxID=34485 RepID=A0ACC2S061_9FUNG|nr:Vacuolar protein sorting-associated protein 68 [Entomophthora muscae]